MSYRFDLQQKPDGSATIVVLVDGDLLSATEEHTNFRAIVAAAMEGTPDIADLFDVSKAVARKFEDLSERVSVGPEGVYFDGDLVDNTLTSQIVRFLDEGVDDWVPLVNFMENVMANPSENSRKELYGWLAADDLTITDDGLIVGYKGCNIGEGGVPVSTRQAPEKDQVRVDGELVTGYVPNEDGVVVTMPRSQVDPNLNSYCSVGLHVGTYGYAKSFARVVLKVLVNPRDVVSVTADSNREKIRTCRYTVVGPVTEKTASAKEDLTVKQVTDTRDNYKSQERYPKGHPKAGQFKPKA